MPTPIGPWIGLAHEVAKIVGRHLATKEVRRLKACKKAGRAYIRNDDALSRAKKQSRIERLRKLKVHFKKRFRAYDD